MKTCPSCHKQNRNDIDLCDCGHIFPSATPEPLPEITAGHPIAGAVLIIIGVAVVLFFAFGYDTTVDVTVGAGYLAREQTVQNLGRECNRLIGVIIGCAAALAGTILLR
jgi:hypothetical protein